MAFALLLASPALAAPLPDPPANPAPDLPGATPADQLQQIESEIEEGKARLDALAKEADTLAARSADLQRQLIEAADKVQNREQTLSDIEARLFALVELEKATVASLGQRRDQISRLVGALESLALNRPPTLGVTPDDATEAARSAMLLNALIPALAAESGKLERELSDLKQVRTEIGREQSEVVAAARSLETERAALAVKVDEMAQKRDETMDSAQAAQDRLNALAHQAADMRQLLALLNARGLDASPRPKPADGLQDAPAQVAALSGPIKTLKGKLRPPVTGAVTLGFGADTDDGGKNRGILIAARPDAQVVAPCDGTVVFSGPFRGYGLLLIIRSDDGYHFVLSGLSRIDAVARQRLLAGEPIGIMGDRAAESSGAQGAESGPQLYVELRRDGEPIDPEPWLAMTSGKVSG